MVPFLKLDQQSMKLEPDKCLDVLCFTPAASVSEKKLTTCYFVVSVSNVFKTRDYHVSTRWRKQLAPKTKECTRSYTVTLKIFTIVSALKVTN